jgi:hypothetical protein
MQHENNPTQVELSAIWLELLGQSAQTSVPASTTEESIPTLETDPWSHLLYEQGTKIVDLQKVSLHMSDQEVEQILQQLQEQKES